MSESRRRTLLVLPGAALALLVLAAPTYAEPDAPPGAGRSGDAPAQTGSLPAPEHAAADEAVAQSPPAGAPAPQGPPAGVPQGPPADPGAGAPPAEAPPFDAPPAEVPAPPAATAAKGQRVVVCKYVRKPGDAEIFSHIIVVNENALLGKGFAGTFPFAFSDAHFNSLAVRYAERGEQASEISAATCPVGTPPVEEPPGGTVEEPPGDVGGIVDDAPPAAPPADTGGEAGEVLPATGAPSDLLLLALLGGLGALGGTWLVLGGRKAGAPLN